MDPGAVRAPEMRALWKEALEGCLGRQVDLPIDQDTSVVDARNFLIVLDGLI